MCHTDEYKRENKTRSSAIAVIADRTACSILTLFIMTATSRPLNKKSVCCQSAMQQLLRICVCSPHTSVCTCNGRQGLCY